MPARHNARPTRSGPSFAARLGIFAVVALAVVGLALWLTRPAATPAQADQTMQIDMGGFQPAELHVAGDRVTTLRLVNPDSPYHSDGGGVHQFAVPDLGIDVKVQPRSSAVVTIPAAKAGTYVFYCDVCCGGKENPSMRGKLVVT